MIKKDEQWKNISWYQAKREKDKPSRYTFGDKNASSRFKKEGIYTLEFVLLALYSNLRSLFSVQGCCQMIEYSKKNSSIDMRLHFLIRHALMCNHEWPKCIQKGHDYFIPQFFSIPLNEFSPINHNV